MHDPSNPGAQDSAADGTDQSLQQELERVSLELESCRKELLEKNKALSDLRDQLESLSEHNSLSEKEAALKQITADMEKAQEMATMGSWVLEVDTGKVTWTPELHRMFGQDPSCPVPTLEEQEHWYTKQSWDAMIEAVTRTSEDGSPYNIELETIRRDGTTGILRSIGKAERDASGRIVRLRGVAQDISEIKETETQLRLALEKEKAAQIYKDQFLANVSHEIRTPMNGVVGFASLLRDDDLDSETRNDYINTIESCSNQLLNLIDDIIDIAKIEAGEIQIEEKPFNLATLTLETAAILEAEKQNKDKGHIDVLIHIPEGSEELQICSDPLRIQQILTNLLSNALKFSNKGTIEFGYELKATAVEFFVKDQGIGIEKERIKLIFQRFEHLEGTIRKYEGTGLGLSISEGLAELLGAKISVDSEFGVGSNFRLEIPLNTATDSKIKQALSGSEHSIKSTQSSTLLVVEDEQVNRKFIERVLRSTSYRVLYAENGEEAIRTYRAHPEIDLVLMDIRMPIMNGDVAAQEILKADSAAKIIAQTAFAMRDERDEFLKIGFVDYISKPYKAEELRGIIQKWTH